MSTKSFAELGVSSAVVSCLSAAGITEPFAIQRAVIGDAIDGRDVIAKSPTGSGKTLAFGIPLAERIRAEDPRPSALVLAPTRELATQIVDDIRDIAHTRALRVKPVYGGVSLVKQAKEAATAHVLVATPGRLEDLLGRGAFTLDNISMLILDEADRMLDMGFRPAIDRIVAACPRSRQTLFFSATLDGEAGLLAKRYADDPAVHEHGPRARRANAEIEHRFVPVEHEHRVEALVQELRRDRDLTLVFVRTKHGADRLVKRLGSHGITRGGDARQQVTTPARAGTRPLRARRGRHTRRDGRRRTRDRRGADLARDQFRPAGRQRDLRPPDRPNRPRRP